MKSHIASQLNASAESKPQCETCSISVIIVLHHHDDKNTYRTRKATGRTPPLPAAEKPRRYFGDIYRPTPASSKSNGEGEGGALFHLIDGIAEVRGPSATCDVTNQTTSCASFWTDRALNEGRPIQGAVSRFPSCRSDASS